MNQSTLTHGNVPKATHGNNKQLMMWEEGNAPNTSGGAPGGSGSFGDCEKKNLLNEL